MSTSKKTRILILAGSAGTGHVSAARAMESKLKSRGYDVRNVDIVEHMTPFSKWIFREGWIKAASLVRPLYSALHYLLNHKLTSYRDIARNGQRGLYERMKHQIEEARPDIIISTHAVGVILAVIYKESYPDVFVVAQATDYQAINTLSYPEVDMICSTDKASKRDFVKYGVKPERVALMGPAIRDEFIKKRDRGALRRKLKLPAGGTNILVSRGGIGTSAKFTTRLIEEILKLPQKIYVVVNSGRSEYIAEATKELVKRYPGKVEDIGYVNNLDEYLHACDFYICKPGGLSISESLASERPPISFMAMPGQEEWNVKFITKNKLGFYGTDRNKIVDYLVSLIENKKKKRKLLDNLKAYDHTYSSAEISDEIIRRYKAKRA